MVPPTVTAVDVVDSVSAVVVAALSSADALLELDSLVSPVGEAELDTVGDSCAVGVPDVLPHAPTVSRAAATTAGSSL
jgi:hypothetical protein